MKLPKTNSVRAEHVEARTVRPSTSSGRTVICFITVSLFIFQILFAFSSCAAKTSKEGAPKLQIQTFKSSKDWNKLDGRFKQAWEKAMTDGDAHKNFECLVKTKTKPTIAEKKSITEKGFKYRTVIGRIVTGSVEAKDVPEVASLPLIKIMELAVPLSPK